MTFMTFTGQRRVVATILAAASMALPASSWADTLPSSYRSDAAQSDSAGTLPSTDRSDAAQSGWHGGSASGTQLEYPPSEFNGGDRAQSQSTTESTITSHPGDNPADHPGMSRAPQYDAPTMIEVVRPERTIVRDVDQALPLILSSTALLLVLAGFGVLMVRGGLLRRLGRSH